MKVLVSGFEPFLDEKVNPTEKLATHVNSCDFHGAGGSHLDVRGVVLPVVFVEAFDRLEAERKLFQPDVIICFGLAGGRERIDVEMVAINSTGGEQALRVDNRGQVLNGKVIDHPLVPLALPTTLPVDKILQSLESRSIVAGRSYSAGTYVCNDLFFRVQERLRFTRVRSGFIHVPRLESNGFSWPTFENALAAILHSL